MIRGGNVGIPVAAPQSSGPTKPTKTFALPKAAGVARTISRDAVFAQPESRPSPFTGLTNDQIRTVVRDAPFAQPESKSVLNQSILNAPVADMGARAMAAIRADTLAPGATGWGIPVLDTLTKQVLGLPSSTLVGLENLGKAAGDAFTGNFSPLGNTLSGMVTQDPIVQAIEHGSLKPLAQNPLGTLLDASVVGGIGGKALGALARTGALGDAAGAAAALSRAPLETVPGVEGSVIKRVASPNLFTKGFQAIGDQMRSNLPDKLQASLNDSQIRRMVAMSHAGSAAAHAADERSVISAIQQGAKGLKGAAVERTVAPEIIGAGGGRAVLDQLLENMLKENAPAVPSKAARYETAVKSLQDAISKDEAGAFNWQGVRNAADLYAKNQSKIEDMKAQLDMQSAEKMANRTDKERALLEPNVHNLATPTTNPVLKQAVRDLKAQRTKAVKDLGAAQGARDAYLGRAGQRGAYGGASNALAQLMRATPVHPVTDSLMNRMIDLRQILDEAHPGLKAFHELNVESKQNALKDVTERLMAARKALTSNKLAGTMIEDQSMPALTSGPLKGMRVRPITADDIAAIRAKDIAEGKGPGFGTYVSRINPERKAIPTLASELASKRDLAQQAAEKGLGKYTGESLISGDYRHGWSALGRSQLTSLDRIHKLLEQRAFEDRWAIPSDEGHVAYTGPGAADAAQKAAEEFTARTGMKTVVREDSNGELRVFPKSAMDELKAARSMDRPSAAAKLITKPNAIFRKTVLPYSPKLPVMHTVENLSRTALLEKGNPVRAVGDYLRMRNFMKALPDDQRKYWEGLVTPGGLSRSGAAGEMEDLGRLPAEHGPVMTGVDHVIHGLDSVSTHIIAGQRWLEKHAQTVAGGAYLRQQLREMGHGFADAETAFKRYTNELVAGRATVQDAEAAARMMHRVYGQYNAFTASSAMHYGDLYFSPRQIMRVMPFLPWYMNAARLVFQILPHDHPLFLSMAQDVNHAVQQQWAQQHQGLPGDLQTAMPVGRNAWLDVGKLTPIGLPNQSPLTTAAQLTLPWASSSALALAGLDPFGAELKGPTTPFGQSFAGGIFSGKPQNITPAILEATEQLAQALGGPLNDISRGLYSHGGTFYNTDTPVLHLLSGGTIGSVATKPGSTKQQMGLLGPILGRSVDRVLDPFRPTTYAARGSKAAGYSPVSSATAGPSLSGATNGPLSGATAGPSLSGAH